jgi:hypothetical protein
MGLLINEGYLQKEFNLLVYKKRQYSLKSFISSDRRNLKTLRAFEAALCSEHTDISKFSAIISPQNLFED